MLPFLDRLFFYFNFFLHQIVLFKEFLCNARNNADIVLHENYELKLKTEGKKI